MKYDIYMEDKNDSKKKRLLILLIILVIVFVGWKVLASKNTTKKVTTPVKKMVLVDCTSTTADKPQKVEGWKTYMYPSINDEKMERHTNQTVMQESYSIVKLNDKTEANNVYYRVELESMGDLPRETRKIIEFCDENNKTVQLGTTKDTNVTGASEGVQASVSRLATYYMQNKPGIYRMDGYLFINGKWTLTDRIDAIKLTE